MEVSVLFKCLLLSYLIILGFLSLNPWVLPDPEPAIGFISWDLLDHAAAYGLLSVLMMIALRRQYRPLIVTSIVISVSSMIGVLFEYGQYWLTSTRHFSVYDAAANIFGAVLGVTLLWSVWIYRKRYVSGA
jgi:VanZ family protein